MEELVEELVRHYIQNEQNLHLAYSLVWDQGTDLLWIKVKALNNYVQIKCYSDMLASLKEIKGVTFKFEDQHYVLHSLYKWKRSFYNLRQNPKIQILSTLRIQ